MLKNITHVRGFTCWGAHMGIKSKRRDLALIYSDVPASAAAVFTRNVVCAEPIKLSRKHIKNGKAQAFVINSGNANACTGTKGMEGAVAMAETTAKELKIPVNSVIVASTGLIGEPFPTDKVLSGIRESAKKLSSRDIAGSLAANAILTTDTFAKEGFTSFNIEGIEINMAGIAKGSGMIHPNMGTMLGFIVCDIAITSKLLDEALRTAVDKSFNMITVDGDTSTNDMVSVMCNGKAGNPEINKKDANYDLFVSNLTDLCAHLARLIVSDGEGSTKLIEYRVNGAKSEEDARQIVRTVSNSNLVKTAIFGSDPNWGRIIAAAGRAGVNFDPDKLDLFLGTEMNSLYPVLKQAQPVEGVRKKLLKVMNSSTIIIVVDLNQGDEEAVGWGSDFSYEYVRINAEYTT
ncbi:bifunctional glutamate N-acetyltransferase/amino-acid acetyltransferase ArgJ [Rhodohalobacter mucosus]|uniref:Arginine biosynthesis bifunctional protein ArgJ n=1 Tax=Rhodohalobacter mucosus TaxID=2079485 RepID=A0A316TX68_9BACT|nr:bifunctional glutamate N-acetyltransferase/amino-acid acetyltransferase ArgJ [Rhodohalobacter mucosus]PWN07184.1 amino acid acetyltransferase [Rhodohalobacter mucosus]